MISPLQIQLRSCTLLIVIVLPALQVEAALVAGSIARPGCNDTCGNVSIPFPFGIGPNCFRDDWFEIECRVSPNPNGSTKPFLSKLKIEVMEVTLGDRYLDPDKQRVIVSIPPLNACSADTQPQPPRLSSIDLRGGPYTFSAQHNVFVMEGCPGSVEFLNQSKKSMGGCATICHNNKSTFARKICYGVECCQAPLPSSLQLYEIDFNIQSPGKGQNCLVATLIKNESVEEYVGKLSNSSSAGPTVLTWRWMSNLEPDTNPHRTCHSISDGKYCVCNPYYYGNPYVTDGCQALTIVFGLLLLTPCYGVYRSSKRRKEREHRAKFFKRNGGLLLQHQVTSNEGVVDKTELFNVSELNKATDNFNKNRVLGQGGQGTVYKGMLADGRIVAIKKSNLVDESQVEQFINEVVILSKINHINIVKLLGCCLETEVILLVYEFIPNGTLSQHMHTPNEEFAISWEMRMKIAADSAGAIAYLHSSSYPPIYHRDIKSSNILLDDQYRAKVSDFGISRSIPLHQTHLSTDVRGTFGYLDPEYFQTLKFTGKSDVYGFGVVLLELLTGKKAVYGDELVAKNLATEFQLLMDDSRLSEILDPEVVKEAKEDELVAVVELARRCLSWNGKLRPSMKEVAVALEMIMKSPAQVSTWYQQAFPTIPEEAGLGEDVMDEIREADFASSSTPACAESPLYIDVQPLLPNTVYEFRSSDR